MKKTYTETFQVEIERDLHTHQVINKTYRNEIGELHGGLNMPAVIQYDLDSGKPIQLERWFDGRRHGLGVPAVEVIDPDTGVIIGEEWFKFGNRHRTDGPAFIVRDAKTGTVTRSEEYTHEYEDHNIPKSRPPKPA